MAIAAVAFLAATMSPAFAADDKKLTPQQEKMKACNTEAGEKKGDERKAFMSQCLKAGAPAAPMTQQEKMKKCNVDANAKALKGDDRKAFMSECLKGDKKS
jgi:psiF repeat-containing protein